MGTAYTLPYNPNDLPDFSNLTPAQNAQITAILQAQGILTPTPPSNPCDPANLATISADKQAYARQLCAMGQSGYNVGNGLANYNLSQVELGINQLPSSASAAASFAAQPITDAVNAISSIPTWLWLAALAVGGILVVEILK